MIEVLNFGSLLLEYRSCLRRTFPSTVAIFNSMFDMCKSKNRTGWFLSDWSILPSIRLKYDYKFFWGLSKYNMFTLKTLLRIPILRPKWHKYDTLNRVIRVALECLVLSFSWPIPYVGLYQQQFGSDLNVFSYVS